MVGGVWYAVTVPTKAPEAARQRLMKEALSATGDAEVRDKLAAMGVPPWSGTLPDFLAFMKADLALFEADIKRGGVKAD
jgi:hypothetical protein